MFLNGFTHPPIDRTRLGRADDYLKLLSFAMGDGGADDWLPECRLSHPLQTLAEAVFLTM
jgi:hypothetical protein